MNIKLNDKQELYQAVISGDLDQHSLNEDFWPLLNEKEKRQLVSKQKLQVIFDDLNHIDTAGLAWLINLKISANQHKIQVSFDDLPARLVSLAKLSNANALFGPETDN